MFGRHTVHSRICVGVCHSCIAKIELQEDVALTTHVDQYMAERGYDHPETISSEGWSAIASRMTGCERTGKQCKDRYLHHLAPTISSAPWTEKEERLMFQMQATFGNAWVEIARQLPG